MSLNLDNSKYNQYFMSSVCARGVEEADETFSVASSCLEYITRPAGIDVYVPENTKAIVILEPLRNLRWQYGDDSEVTTSCVAGTVFFIPAHQAVVITWPKDTCCLFVDIKSNSSTEDDVKALSSHQNFSIFSSKKCLQISKIIVDEFSADFDQSYIDYFHKIISHIIIRYSYENHVSGVKASGLSNYSVRQIDNYLKENFRKQLSVPDMANSIGISAGHFASCFRESFGQTPHQYLMYLRLNEAERCLKETDVPISEIAASLSFSSQSHLTTALRKYRQLTPGEIRRRNFYKKIK